MLISSSGTEFYEVML